MFQVVEGFYGKPWSHNERLDMIGFLSAIGFDGYCYAPKFDKKLRQEMNTPFDAQEVSALLSLAEQCERQGIDFKIGLSPYKYLNPELGRKPLLDKFDQLKQIPHCTVALFFDDISINDVRLAEHQVAFTHFVSDYLPDNPIVFCPSYYSFDPVLNKVFGEMPNHYWQHLGNNLDTSIDILWTGEKVISHTYSKEHIEAVARLFNRRPTIWDNSSVSDGKNTSPFLPLGNIADFSGIQSGVAGIWINPMNPAALAKINLLMVSPGNNCGLSTALDKLTPDLTADILDNLSLFVSIGRDKLTDTAKNAVLQKFEHLDNPVALNIIDWVKGVYQFDPDCLT